MRECHQKLTEVVDSLGLLTLGDLCMTERDLERRAQRRLAVRSQNSQPRVRNCGEPPPNSLVGQRCTRTPRFELVPDDHRRFVRRALAFGRGFLRS